MTTYHDLGHLLKDSGRLEEARDCWNKEVGVLETLIKDYPGNPDHAQSSRRRAKGTGRVGQGESPSRRPSRRRTPALSLTRRRRTRKKRRPRNCRSPRQHRSPRKKRSNRSEVERYEFLFREEKRPVRPKLQARFLTGPASPERLVVCAQGDGVLI